MNLLRKLIREQIKKILLEEEGENTIDSMNAKISSQKDNISNLKNLQGAENKKKNATPQNAKNNPELSKTLTQVRNTHDARAKEYTKDIQKGEKELKNMEDQLKDLSIKKAEQTPEDIETEYQQKLDNILNSPL